jgi:hypothetical protein
MSTIGSPNTVTDGLVLALDAANKKSYPGTGTVVSDLSGNTNSTLTNGTTYDSTFGGAFDFDGTNDKIVTPVTASNWADVAFTIQLWTSDCTINDSCLEMGGDGSTNNFGLIGFYWSSNNRISNFWRAGGGAGQAFRMEPPHDRTAPNNLCMTYTGVGGTNTTTIVNNCTLYFNGISQTIITGGNGTPQTTSTLNLGGDSYSLNGKIHNTLYYDRVLTPQEVLQNYNATKTRFGL